MSVTIREKPLGSGRWYTFTNTGGTVRSKYAGTREIAKATQKKLKAALASKHYHLPDPDAPRFTTVATQWLKTVEKLRDIKPATGQNYESFVRCHLLGKHGFSGLLIHEVTPAKIRDFVSALRTPGGSARWPLRGLSAASLRVGLASLRLIMDQAVEDGLLDVSPLSKMRTVLPKRKGSEKKKIEPFTLPELRAIFAEADRRDPAFGTFLRVWVGSGCRRGELLGLKHQHVDFATGMLAIRHTYSRNKLGTPKTATSVRDVSALYPVAEATHEWEPGSTSESRALLPRLRKLQVVGAPEHYVFGGAKPAARSTVEMKWRKLLRAAKVPHRSPETLRHTWASTLLSPPRSANLLAIQEAGGWSSAHTPLEFYAVAMRSKPEHPAGLLVVGNDASA